MKSKNSIQLAVLLALSSAGLASAANTVTYVTGSTAYRSALITAEANVLHALSGGTVFATQFNFVPASGTPALGSANVSVLYTGASGSETIIANSFSGSIAGSVALGNQQSITTFPSPTAYDPFTGTVTAGKATAVTLGTNGAAATGGTFQGYTLSDATNPTTYTGYTQTTHTPDVAMADVFLDSVQRVVTLANTPTQVIVGVVPFVFVAEAGAPTGFTNMTTQQVNLLYGSGTAQLSFFTGVSTDASKTVYALGRDIDSGTRATAFDEVQFGGVTNPSDAITNLPTQYYPLNGSNIVGLTSTAGTRQAGPVTSYEFVPAETVAGGAVFEDVGQGGYASGGDLAAALKAAALSNTLSVGYLGLGDAGGTVGTATILSFNGSSLNLAAGGVLDAPSAAKIEYGQYTFFGFEHLYYLTNSTLITKLYQDLQGGDDRVSAGGVNGITLNAMQVSITDDGNPVSFGKPSF